MRLKFIFVLLALYCNDLIAQSYQVGRASLTFIDSTRNNRNIPAEIYYPADMAGNNVPISIGDSNRFPVLSFGHGFLMSWDAYQNIWDALVPEGYIIAFPKTETGFAPSHIEFGKDIAFLLSEIEKLGNDSSSFLYSRVDTMNCVMGHSMGGGAAFLAAQSGPSVKTIVTFAPAETNPSAITAAEHLNIPSLIFAGSNDCVTPPSTNQIPMHEALQSDCKTFISITGGSHCQMADNNFICSIGEGTCMPPPAISRAQQHMIINRYLLPWLNFQLKDDCSSGNQFDSIINSDSSVSVMKSCNLCNINSTIENSSAFNIDIFPNPFQDTIFVQCGNCNNSKVEVVLRSLSGTKLYLQTFSNVHSDDILNLGISQDTTKGMYLIEVTVDGIHCSKKVIRQ